MPAVVTEAPSRPAPPDPPRKQWTRAECATLEASGLLDQQHLELIEGDLISKMGKKRPHVDAATLLQGWLIQVFGGRFVNPEAPIDVAPEDNQTNEPVPDLVVLKRNFSKFRSATPQPEDLDLVVEVADTTLTFDLIVKAALYERARIVEYWVLDVTDRRLIVHRDPQSGRFASIVAYGEHESVAPLGGAPERVSSSLGLIFVGSCSPRNQKGFPMATLSQEIIALERSALDRWITFDPQGYLDLSAPEVTYCDPMREKRIDGREALRVLLEPIKQLRGTITEPRYEMIHPKVQQYGDVALLTYNLTNYGRLSGGPEAVLARWNSSEVYARVGETWKPVHSHWSYTKPDLTPQTP